MQVMIGIKNGMEVSFDENQRIVNYTDTIKDICNDFFENHNFTEDEEEITYKVIHSKKFVEILQLICKKQEETICEIKKVLGNERKNDLVNILFDYSLIISLLAEAISLVEKNNDVYIILI